MNEVRIEIRTAYKIDRPYDSTLTKWYNRACNAIRYNEMVGNTEEVERLKKHRDYLGGLLAQC